MKKIYLIKTLLLLFALVAGSGSVWAETVTYKLTIDANDFNKTSYVANNNEKTSNAVCTTDATKTFEVKWTSSQVMRNGDNMQWQKSNGCIYNSTDLGTITSVTVTSSAGSFTTYYGTVAQPTSGTSVGNGYFQIKVGSATGTSSKVEVTFTVDEGSADTRTETSVTIDHSGVNSNIFNGTDGGSLSATVSADGSAIAGASVTWSSSNGNVATIDEDGAITLLATGVTTITASYAGDQTYKPSSAAYELTVIYNNPDAITLWNEDFSSYSANDVPSRGTYSYSCVNGKSDTKIYNEHIAGGTVPELLVGKSGGRFSATIPLNNIEGDLRLTYRTNAYTLLVSNNFEEGYVLSETAGEHTVTISGVTHNMTEITITFAAGGNDNVRLDDIHLEGSEYKPAVVAPTFSVPGGAYYTTQSVELSCTTEGATIYYTTDGTDPTSESTVYSGPISVSSTTRISAIAIKGSDVSEIAVATYTITQKDDVIFDIDNQELTFGSTFTLEADVHYFTDGEVTLTSDNDEVVTIDGLTVTAAAVGSATITVDAAEGDTFNAGSKTFTVTVTAPEGLTAAAPSKLTIFEETFAGCNGTGGNSNGWAGSIATSTLVADNEGWTFSNGNGADQCAKFGTSSNQGSATTPALGTAGTLSLSFRAGAWNTSEEGTTLNLSVSESEGTIPHSSVTLTKGQFNTYTATISNATADTKITFEAAQASKNRFFLDDVVVSSTAPAITVNLNASGYATFCSMYPLDFTNAEADGYSAWQIKDIDLDNKIIFEQITGNVKGGTGIFLKGTAGETITLTSVDSETVLSDNKLVGTLAPTYVGNDEYYGLSGNNFVKINAGTVPAGKAIIDADHITEDAGAQARFTFIFADATGISEVEHGTLNADETVYDLQGRRVVKAQKGLYIVNGKKVIMK